MSFLLKLDLISWLPAALTAFVSVVIVNVSYRFLLSRQALDKEVAWTRQIFFAAIIVLCVVFTILAFPISTATRGQIFNLLGIAFTAVIALSSTSFVGNLMSALMLKVVGSIRPGDFLRVEGYFGRVSEQGLLHTEIQTEERTLTTIPNMYLITHPHTVVRSKGTILSAEVSLGYDVSRHKIEKALLEAAEKTGLKDPYVQVLNLGDFSVNYRVAGFLEKIKFLITMRSELHAHVLDSLHEHKIEIVSPTFMNQRRVESEQVFIPKKERLTQPVKTTANMPEEMIFDKAEEAESKESVKELLDKITTERKELAALIKTDCSDEEKEKAESRIASLDKREQKLLEILKKLEGPL